MIVGNKIDQEGREVDIEEGRELAKEMGAVMILFNTIS